MTEHALLLELDTPSWTPPDVRRYWQLTQEGHSGANLYVMLLGMKPLETDELLKKVQAGFLFSTFERLLKNIVLPPRELASLIQIPQRTLVRRKERGRLEPAESDSLLRVSRVIAAVIELFEGDLDASRRWMFREQKALANKRPLDLLSTELGTREVETLVGRLEHGVFS